MTLLETDLPAVEAFHTKLAERFGGTRLRHYVELDVFDEPLHVLPESLDVRDGLTVKAWETKAERNMVDTRHVVCDVAITSMPWPVRGFQQYQTATRQQNAREAHTRPMYSVCHQEEAGPQATQGNHLPPPGRRWRVDIVQAPKRTRV